MTEGRERILREIVRFVAGRGGSVDSRSLKGWIGQQYSVSWRTVNGYLEDLSSRGALVFYFGAIELTPRGVGMLDRLEVDR